MQKNAIMMIDFALDAERTEGLPPVKSIYQACLLRFRPIMMTTMAALLGALPLALRRGTGSELRRPLGIAIVGGLLLSQLITLYTTPVIYLYLDRLGHWVRRGRPAADMREMLPLGEQPGPPAMKRQTTSRTLRQVSECRESDALALDGLEFGHGPFGFRPSAFGLRPSDFDFGSASAA